jgi:hypothetical protein
MMNLKEELMAVLRNHARETGILITEIQVNWWKKQFTDQEGAVQVTYADVECRGEVNEKTNFYF